MTNNRRTSGLVEFLKDEFRILKRARVPCSSQIVRVCLVLAIISFVCTVFALSILLTEHSSVDSPSTSPTTSTSNSGSQPTQNSTELAATCTVFNVSLAIDQCEKP